MSDSHADSAAPPPPPAEEEEEEGESTASSPDTPARSARPSRSTDEHFLDLQRAHIADARSDLLEREQHFWGRWANFLQEKETIIESERRLEYLRELKPVVEEQMARLTKFERLLDKRQGILEKRRSEIRDARRQIRAAQQAVQARELALEEGRLALEAQRDAWLQEQERAERERQQRKLDKIEEKRRLQQALDPLVEEQNRLKTAQQLHDVQLESLRELQQQIREDNARLDARLASFLTQKEELIAKERDLHDREIALRQRLDGLAQREEEVKLKLAQFEEARAICEEQAAKAAQLQKEAEERAEQLELEKAEFELRKTTWEMDETGPRPKNNTEKWLEFELARLKEDRDKMDEEMRRLQAAQEAFVSRMIRFSEEKTALIEKERKSEEVIQEYTERVRGMQERIDLFEKKEADLANLARKLEAEQKRLDLGWSRLGEKVKDLKAARAKVEAENAAVQAKLKANDDFLKQVEAIRGPFDKVAEGVEVMSRKLTLQNVREFWNPEEAKALTDIEQVHQYFKIREIEMTKRERLLNEEIERLRDAADRDRLRYEKMISDLKRDNAELQRHLDGGRVEMAQISTENQQFSSVIKDDAHEVQVLEERLSEEKRRRRELEIVLERKMIALELMTGEREKERRKVIKVEAARLRAAFTVEQEAREKEICAEVKARLTQKFRTMRNDLIQKAALDMEELKARCDRERRQKMTEEAESIRRECQEQYQRKFQAYLQAQAPSKKKKRHGSKPPTFPEESES